MSGDAAKLSLGEIAHTVFLCHRKAALVAGDEPGGMHTHTHAHTIGSQCNAGFLLFRCEIKIIINKNKTFGVNVRRGMWRSAEHGGIGVNVNELRPHKFGQFSVCSISVPKESRVLVTFQFSSPGAAQV